MAITICRRPVPETAETSYVAHPVIAYRFCLIHSHKDVEDPHHYLAGLVYNMETESKLNTISDLSEQTNPTSVIHTENVTLSEPAVKKIKKSETKELEEDLDDRDRKKKRRVSLTLTSNSFSCSKHIGCPFILQDSRDRSPDRSRRHRDRSSSRDRHRRHDRERDGDRDKDRSEKSKVKDKEKEGDDDKEKSEKSSDKPKDRERDRDRDRDSRYRSDRDRERERDRDRGSTRDRERERERDRDRGRDSRRSRRSESRSPSRRRRSPDRRRRSRSPSHDDRRSKSHRRSQDRDVSSKKGTDEADSGPKQITLRDIIAANPGISVPEAVMRLNAYNTAVARGLVPDPITTPSQQSAAIAAVAGGGILGLGGAAPLINAAALGSLGVIGEGGAATKPHRELYVGNLPPGITVPQLAEFVNTAFKQLNLSKDPTLNTVVTAWVSPDGHFAFMELRTIEEATAALTYLNGIQVGAFNLKIGRPKGYNGSAAVSSVAVPMVGTNGLVTGGHNPLLAAMSGLGGGVGLGLGGSNPLMMGLSSTLGLGVGAGGDGLSHTIMVTNLPALISVDQIRELFTPFGELKAFNVIKAASGQTQSAVFEYVNQALTDGVVGGMNNLDIADHKISVQRIPASSAAVLLQPTAVSVPATVAAPTPTAVAAVGPAVAALGPPVASASTTPDALESYPPSTVVRMSNMTTDEDLRDDDLFDELTEDVAGECNSHGVVKSIVIPRGPASGPQDTSVGKIFVHFTDIAGATRSRQAVAGRRFNGRVVEAYFYPEELFVKKIYNLPENYSASRSNGHSSNGHVATEDINDIDEGPSSSAAGSYDPVENIEEDLD